MDATKKPLLIPPQFSTYAEKHNIYEIYERLLKKLLICQPDDPLQSMIDWLKEPESVSEVVILGPPGAGKRSIARLTADKITCVYICKEDLLLKSSDKEVVESIKERVSKADCIEKGYVLEGLPENREQALGLQIAGIFPKHVVLLEAPDSVLMERVVGKRVDSLTGDVYHMTFYPPPQSDLSKRIIRDSNCTEPMMVKRLAEYHRTIDDVMRCYANLSIKINADQPREDVFSQTMSYLSMKGRNNAPHTPRVLLLGPPGSGKTMQASLLCSKYGLVEVSCDELLQQLLVNESDIGILMKSYVDRGAKIPGQLITKALTNRLGQLDAVKRGWVLHGFPQTRNQIDTLTHMGYEPNRVVVLDVSSDVAVERVSLCAVDPISGERYHLLYDPPGSAEVKTRLSMHPKDNEDEILAKYTDYQVNIKDILEIYPSAQHINGDQDIHSVFESIETIVVNPLPNKLD